MVNPKFECASHNETESEKLKPVGFVRFAGNLRSGIFTLSSAIVSIRTVSLNWQVGCQSTVRISVLCVLERKINHYIYTTERFLSQERNLSP